MCMCMYMYICIEKPHGNQKPATDSHTLKETKRKESKHNVKENHQTTWE